MLWSILILIVVPAIEVGIFIWTSTQIGILPIVLMIILTGMLGIALWKKQGAELVRSAQLSMARGQSPAQELMDGITIIIGGILLITPGFFTDFVGFLFILPWTRPIFRQGISWLIMKQMAKKNILYRHR
ncbi:MAG TPA: FxsA family protein [Pseudogracilibacillus sp.]|nr:FxsA family protein [Pseudogracilibacillus sp.]